MSRSQPHASVDQLVEEQVHRWTQFRPEEQPAHNSPVVAISRQEGTLGEAAARILARNLGMEFYDHELVQRMADSSSYRAQVIDALDERTASFIEDLFMHALTQHGLTSDEYFALLVKTIGTIAWHGNAVIVGRGAAHIIPRTNCLTVRFVAPVDTRIEILSAERGIGSEEARNQIVRADLARREFLKHYFRTTPEHDLATFDLVINNQYLGLRASVEVLETALLAKTSAAMETSNRFPS